MFIPKFLDTLRPDNLRRELLAAHRAIREDLDRLGRRAFSRLLNDTKHAADYGEVVRIDPPAAGATVLLPKVSAATTTPYVTILIVGDQGSVTLEAVDSTVMGAASLVYSAGKRAITASLDPEKGWLVEKTNESLDYDWTGIHTWESEGIFGDPGFEASSITVNGTTYNAFLKVSDIGNNQPALFHLHKHATGLGLTTAPVMAFSRTNTNDATHAAVVANQGLGRLVATGHDGTDYVRAGFMSFEVDGTPGSNDMPGRIAFGTTADGASSPTLRFTINNAGAIGLGSPADFGSSGQAFISAGDASEAVWATVDAAVIDQSDDYTWTGAHVFSSTLRTTGELLVHGDVRDNDNSLPALGEVLQYDGADIVWRFPCIGRDDGTPQGSFYGLDAVSGDGIDASLSITSGIATLSVAVDLTHDYDWTGDHDFGGAFITSTHVTDTLAATEDDYSPTGLAGAAILYLTPNGGGSTITGIAGQQQGRRILICNSSTTNNITLPHFDTGSSAANRFHGPNFEDFELGPRMVCEIIYVRAGGNLRWYILGTNHTLYP